jgi:hypothetical protein
MYIAVNYIRKLIYNALLWTPGKGDAKKTQSAGLVKVTLGGAPPTFLSTDGYVVVASGGDGIADRQLWFRGEDLKRVLQQLPTDVSEIEISNERDLYYFGKTEIIDQGDNDEKFWKNIHELAFSEHHDIPLEVFREFYLDPRRVQKFSLVEPRAEYPLAFAEKQTQFGQPVFMWKYGPDLRGLLAPLQVEALVAAYPDDTREVLW